MARQEYNKLVRDRIPEIIQAEGRQCAVDIMTAAEFAQALREKLVEEAREAAAAEPARLAAELADLREVVDALMELQGLSAADVTAVQRAKHTERGGFARRLRLRWTE